MTKFLENSKLEFVASETFDWVAAHGENNMISVTSLGVQEILHRTTVTGILSSALRFGKNNYCSH